MKSHMHHLVFFGVFCQFLLQASLEDQKEDSKSLQKKSDRFGMGWWDPEPWLGEPQPPAPLMPPVRPGPPKPPAPLEQARPPAPLVQPPAPIQNSHHGTNSVEHDHVSRGGVHAEDINCVRSNGVTLLSAVLIPPPEYASQPVFEDASGPNYSPADCAMRPNEVQGYPSRLTFAMYVQHFQKCGVRVQQGSDGKEWISVTLRFPYMEGLRMAEDEYVMVMCKPQDRVATTHHVVDIRGTASEGRSMQTKKVFRSNTRDVACRMSLMAKVQGSRSFNKEMKSGSMVRVGQDLQIRGVVKDGDGWNYAMLKDVIISRVSGNKILASPRTFPSSSLDLLGNGVDVGEVYRDHRPVKVAESTSHDLAQLVFSDGCRNPTYRPVAPFHPQRDPKTPLSVSFTFKAFMFQDMLDGESLRLSAQVVACTELADCQQLFCDGQRGLGRRKRTTYDNSSMLDSKHNVKNFSEDFQLVVSTGGYSKTPLASADGNLNLPVNTLSANCKLMLISVSSAALLFSLITTSVAAIAIGSRRKSLMAPSNEEKSRRRQIESTRRK